MKPKKGKYGYLQGTCDRCGEDDLPLIKRTLVNGTEAVCDTCADTIKRVEDAKVKIKQTDADKEFLDRALNE